MASTNDVIKPFDPTAYTSITGLQLAQLIDGIIPYTDKGLIVSSTDANGIAQAPDADSETKWKNYIWRRVGFDGNIYLYVWNETISRDATFYRWQSINLTGIPSNTIGTSQIQDSAITNIKVSDVAWSKITGVPPSVGDISGTYPALSLAALSVTASKIADDTITGSKVADDTITFDKIAKSAVALQIIRTNAGATATEWFTPSRIVDSANGVVTTDNALKIPQVATAGAGDTGTWQMANIQGLNTQAGNSFTSDLIALSSGGAASIAHSLKDSAGADVVPSIVRGVFRCNSADLGYSAGEEVDSSSILRETSYVPVVVVGATDTDVTYQFGGYGAGNLQIIKKTSAFTYENIDKTKWDLKIYARV